MYPATFSVYLSRIEGHCDVHRAYAKINLGLYVIRKREDGYHDIETVFHRIDLFDEISLKKSAAISVTTTDPETPSAEGNICFKAALLLQRHYGTTQGAEIAIRKAIPVGGGLGGGSSDAATVLRELPRLWDFEYDPVAARAMAFELGADVGYFLGRGSALGRGRGEILSYFDLRLPWTILLCNPRIHVPTAWAYQQMTPEAGRRVPDLRELLNAALGEPAILREYLRNDFEPVVFKAHPEISAIRGTMVEAGALFASMSGSGSSVYGFFADTEAAEELSARFGRAGYSTSVTPPFFDPL